MKRLIIFGLLVVFYLTTAWASQGWYLLTPPLILDKDSEIQVSVSEPFSKWVIRDAFDNVAECKTYKENEIKKAVKQTDTMVTATNTSTMVLAFKSPFAVFFNSAILKFQTEYLLLKDKILQNLLVTAKYLLLH